jgi:hypothetical protein
MISVVDPPLASKTNTDRSSKLAAAMRRHRPSLKPPQLLPVTSIPAKFHEQKPAKADQTAVGGARRLKGFRGILTISWLGQLMATNARCEPRGCGHE